MLLFVLSTEGGDREDCNIFYATYLMVDAADHEKPKVTALLKGLFKTDGPSANILAFKQDQDARADLVFEEQDRLVRFLAAQGYTAKFTHATFVVQDHGF